MYKLLSELIVKLLMANGVGLEKGKGSFWRNIAVILIIAGALGLLQYSEVMLNVRKIKAAHEIERPIELLELKLESCKAMLGYTHENLAFCRSKTLKPLKPLITNPLNP